MRLFVARMVAAHFLRKGSDMAGKGDGKTSQGITLEALLENALAKSGGKETFSIKQLRRQIAAKKSGQTSRDLYVTGSFKNNNSE